MVSSSMLTFISRRLSEISDNSLPFGGYNVITVGDYFQLRPVKGNFAFENVLLWHLFEPFFLTENMRQNENSTFFYLLNRVRLGLPSELDLQTLKSRLITESIDFENVLHIFPLRKQVEAYNIHLLSKISSNILSISASHYFSQSDENALGSVDEKYIPKDDRLAGGLCSILRIAINARVMLVRNINTESGLVNGAMGTVTEIPYETNNGQAEPTKIHVLFDNKNVGRINCADSTLLHNPIPIECVQYEFSYGGRQIVRMQFPLVLSWGCTVHKVQGLSLDSAVIHLGSDVFEKGMAYVALSRAEGNQQLVTKSLKIVKKSKELQSYVNKTQNKEMVFFNVIGLQGRTYHHLRIYQRGKFHTIKEGMSFKFTNIVQKDKDLFWATSGSLIAYTSAVEVDPEIEKCVPPLPEERPVGGMEVDLERALKSPEKSTVQGKIIMVITY
ncbi:uncharacterized protein LOC134261520 [Saccostrea cucullata]|uniref:uncharacterized protein LOC134261520 n=1 Tax=Saccostrea cuccullata TaxID=36930 RepID=UPI002ED69A8C